mgnify:CR=1 FL=1
MTAFTYMGQNMQEETIVAIATGRGRAGVGIVRLSGRRAVEIASQVFFPLGGKKLTEAEDRRAVYGNIILKGQTLDDGLAILMRGPRSYTGEDVAELQCHGAPALLREIVAACCELGARPAEAGEYTRRAFLNGRLDLLKAQAVMDIIEAKTAASLKLAAGHLSGKASAKISRWRQALLDILVHLEALIDFPEEGIEELSLAEAGEKLRGIQGEMEQLYRTGNTGKILREGLVTAITGAPNGGKSSLLNALLGEERAIVTDIAGTTRDSLEEYADMGGVPLRLIDTAGLRATADPVERLGIQRSRRALEQAELILAVFDGSRPLSEDDRELLRELRLAEGRGKKVFRLLNKQDLPVCPDTEKVVRDAAGEENCFQISAQKGEGLERLTEAIREYALSGVSEEELVEGGVATEWEAYRLGAAVSSVESAAGALADGLGADCAAIDLTAAVDSLGGILGLTASEDVVDHIFSRFCVGK